MNKLDVLKLMAELRAKAKLAASAKIAEEKLKQIPEDKLTVDTASLGLPANTSAEEVKEAIQEILTAPEVEAHLPGVARKVTLNAKQEEFLNLVLKGKDCCLIGAAGTGKTTTMRKVTETLLLREKLPKLQVGAKYLEIGSPGMVILSFTNKAVNNIRHAVVNELKNNTLTIHKLLAFEPVFYDIPDPANPGYFRTTMRFEPHYNKLNTLPSDIKVVAFEESSMIGLSLYGQLQDAMPHPHQEIFLGDIQQLPPVFDSAILGFKLTSVPVVELTEIYRQAANSPIIDLAWTILRGEYAKFSPKFVRVSEINPVSNKKVEKKKFTALEEFSKETPYGEVFFQPWQQPLSVEIALAALSNQLKRWFEQGYYDPEENIILTPYNKSFGTIELNKLIAQWLGRHRDAEVVEVISGIHKHYLAVGDRVLHNKEDAVITAIRRNGNYLGKPPQLPSRYLNRWGIVEQKMTTAEEFLAKQEQEEFEAAQADKLLSGDFLLEDGEAEDERKNSASHIIELKYTYSADDDDDARVILTSSGEVNNLLGGYAITVHKAQGSEYQKVFLVFHHTQAAMISRELIYTGVTRARHSLHIICEPDTFFKGIKTQRISGDTIAEKAQLFKGKALAMGQGVPRSEPLGDAANYPPIYPYRLTKERKQELDPETKQKDTVNEEAGIAGSVSVKPEPHEETLSGEVAGNIASNDPGKSVNASNPTNTVGVPLTAAQKLAAMVAKAREVWK